MVAIYFLIKDIITCWANKNQHKSYMLLCYIGIGDKSESFLGNDNELS